MVKHMVKMSSERLRKKLIVKKVKVRSLCFTYKPNRYREDSRSEKIINKVPIAR